MKILSKYYDCIDYLNDYQSDNVFIRNQSLYNIFSEYKLNNFRDRTYQYQQSLNIDDIFKNQLDWYNIDHLEIYGKFIFLPNHNLDTSIKLNIYNVNNNIQIKIELYQGKDQLTINNKLDKFINQIILKDLTINTDNKVRNQPCWFIIFDQEIRNIEKYNYTWYYNKADKYNIWFNFPLYRIEHLFTIKKEQIYQDLELYLWNDNNIDTMKNISNKDKIIQHGYDLKTSFRKEKYK